MIRYCMLLIIFMFSQADCQASVNSINIPLDSIKGEWVYLGQGVPGKAVYKPLSYLWGYDTFRIVKSKNAKFARKFNNQYIAQMATRGYFANSFVAPVENGKVVDSMVLYHNFSNQCGEHSILYYGNRSKGDIVFRRISVDTIYLSSGFSGCKNGSNSIDSLTYVFIKRERGLVK